MKTGASLAEDNDWVALSGFQPRGNIARYVMMAPVDGFRLRVLAMLRLIIFLAVAVLKRSL